METTIIVLFVLLPVLSVVEPGQNHREFTYNIMIYYNRP